MGCWLDLMPMEYDRRSHTQVCLSRRLKVWLHKYMSANFLVSEQTLCVMRQVISHALTHLHDYVSIYFITAGFSRFASDSHSFIIHSSNLREFQLFVSCVKCPENLKSHRYSDFE